MVKFVLQLETTNKVEGNAVFEKNIYKEVFKTVHFGLVCRISTRRQEGQVSSLFRFIYLFFTYLNYLINSEVTL